MVEWVLKIGIVRKLYIGTAVRKELTADERLMRAILICPLLISFLTTILFIFVSPLVFLGAFLFSIPITCFIAWFVCLPIHYLLAKLHFTNVLFYICASALVGILAFPVMLWIESGFKENTQILLHQFILTSPNWAIGVAGMPVGGIFWFIVRPDKHNPPQSD